MKKICVVTSTRADYGIMKPLLVKLHSESTIDLSIVATGMHLCNEFGNTYREIESDGFAISRKVDVQLGSDSAVGMSKTMGIALISFADYFEQTQPELLILLGDRFEIAAVGCAALNARIPIAHLYGGERTEGAVDDCYRHSITKMSTLHFTSCEEYRKRVIQLGERPDTVFNVGSMGVENVLSMPVLPLSELERELGFSLHDTPYAVVTFHPVTKEAETAAAQVLKLMQALDAFPDMRFIITKSNSDTGGRQINKLWDDYGKSRENCLVVPSLGIKKYLSALKYATMMIGNSSSGMTEGPAFHLPIINIGDRQKGRLAGECILNCPPDADAIIEQIQTARSNEFHKICANAVNLFGNGNTSAEIMRILTQCFENGKVTVKKEFYDLHERCHNG